MIGPEVGQMWFRIVTFLVVFAIVAVLVSRPGSAEFYVSLVTLAIGILFMILLAVLVRKSIK